MTTTLEESNAAVRSAVEIRTENQAAGKPQSEWYDAVTEPMPKTKPAEVRVYGHEGDASDNYADWVPAFQPKGPSAAEVVERFASADTPAVMTLRQAIDAVNDRHQKYGPPTEHFARTAALVNAAFGTTFTAADWALVMVLDKVSRLQGPTPTTDGGVDICGYGSCYEECRQAQ